MSARMKIGYVPLRRDVFSADAAGEQRRAIRRVIEGWDSCDLIEIESINDEGLLFDEKDLPAAIRILKDAEVDGIFLPHCNFGCEHLAAKVAAAIGKPVLLWGPRDDAPAADGTRARDTQCGLFATGKVLRRFNVPFSYIVNCHVTDRQFQNGFRDFLAVCNVVRAFQRIRILQVSTRPDAFWTMMANEGELLEKFGVQVYPITLVDLELEMDSIKAEGTDAAFVKAKESLKNNMCSPNVGQEAIDTLAALKVALGRFAQRFGCSAIALQCWFSMQKKFHIMPCVVNGLLTDEGIPTMCETDLHGAIGSIILQAAAMNARPVFFADMTIRHPTNDNAELLWHCGNFPPSLAKHPEERRMEGSFIIDGNCPGVGVWEIQGGEITVCRFDGDHGTYQLLIGEGHSTEGPANKGTYLWFEVENWPFWEKKLVTGPYVHHCTGVHGKLAHILYEACKYIPGLSPDPVEPTEQQLEARLLNG